MGIQFKKPKRIKMKAALLAAAIMILSFAVATDVKKTAKSTLARNRGLNIPRCAEKHKQWIGTVHDTVENVADVNDCALQCKAIPKPAFTGTSISQHQARQT